MPDAAPMQTPQTPPQPVSESAVQSPVAQPPPQTTPQPEQRTQHVTAPKPPQPTPRPAPQPTAPQAAVQAAGGAAPHARLSTAVEDTQTLLDYAARHAIDIEHDIVAPLIASHDKMAQGGDLNGDEKAQFWAAFSGIIKRVEPVSVDSIHFTKSRFDDNPPHIWFRKLFKKSSPADQVLRRYLMVAVFSLLSLLALQMEWAIGMAIFNDAYKVHGYLLDTTSELTSAKLLSESLKNTDSVAGADAAINLEQLERRHAQDGSWDDVSYVRLWWWNRQIAGMLPPYDMQLSDEGPPVEAGLVKLDAEGQRRIEFTRAQLTLQVISDYVLVALFALLGSMTQALRSLSAEIDAVSLTANRLYAIRTRIILGVIAGVCMAWLIIISSSDNGVAPTAQSAPLSSISFLGAFTPWAMAFISGYSVEIFFAALERAISFITHRIGTMPTTAAKPVQDRNQGNMQQTNLPSASTPTPTPSVNTPVPTPATVQDPATTQAPTTAPPAPTPPS